MDSEALLLERRADRLGLPNTPDMSVEALTAAIAARESDMDNPSFAFVNSRWEINGNLPDGLQFVNDQFVASTGAPQPECFGEMWDGATGGADECAKCVFCPVCREMMAKVTFVAVQAKLGPEATLGVLASGCEISEQSVLALMADLAGGVAKRKKKPPMETVIEEPAPEPVVASPDKAVEPSVAPDPVIPAVEVKRKRGRPRKIVDPALSAIPEVKRKRGRPKKVVEDQAQEVKPQEQGKNPPKPEVVLDPQSALVVKRVKARVLRQKRKERSARTAKAQADAPTEKRWGEHTWRQRWFRERKRVPEIARIVPGAVIKMTRKKRVYEVKAFEGYYELSNGQKCATLSEAAKLLTGNANWSAAKFWGLHKATTILHKKPQAA